MPFAPGTTKSKSAPVNNANVQRQTLRGFGDPAIDQAQETDVQTQLNYAVQFGHGVEQSIQRQAEVDLKEEDDEKETVQRQTEAGLEEDEEKLPVQAKLTIGQPGDKYEQEADQMAAKVMRMPDPGAGESSIQRSAETQEEEEIQAKPWVQRQAMPEENEEEDLQMGAAVQRQMMSGEEEEDTLQTRLQAKGGTPAVPGGFEGQLASHRGGGQPLSDQTRAFMEPRFGADFGGVRVHETPDLANAIQAQAFTHGQDIYFNSGKYNPGSSGGKELLAHELTHVVQQNSNIYRNQEKNQISLASQAKIQGGWLSDSLSSVGNAVGDAFNLRKNEAALDLWEDYLNAQKDLRKFRKTIHSAENFQSTTRLGMFNAVYNPAKNTLKIICKCKFSFVKGSAAQFPDANPKDLIWEKPDQEEWKQNFLSLCSKTWSGKHTFYCQKDWWESLKANVAVEFREVSGDEHFSLKIKKIPKGKFSTSSVQRPKSPRLWGLLEHKPGSGEFDSEDLEMSNKPGGKQKGAAHEAGHMLGLDDEYGTGTPSHSDLVESEFGHGVARGPDGRIMSGGMDVQPEHGVTFLAAIKEATSFSEWSKTQKDPKPKPLNPSSGDKGDFPQPTSKNKFA